VLLSFTLTYIRDVVTGVPCPEYVFVSDNGYLGVAGGYKNDQFFLYHLE
jgi:hypothetical protein